MRLCTLLSCLLAVSFVSGTEQQRNSLPLHLVEGRLWLPGVKRYCSPSLFPVGTLYMYVCCAVFTDQNVKSSKIKLLLSINGGSQLQSFPRTDGSFTFYGVPAGTHMLDVVSLELVFPQASHVCIQSAAHNTLLLSAGLQCPARLTVQVRVDVDGTTGRVAGSYANNPMQAKLVSKSCIRLTPQVAYAEWLC